MKKSLYGIILLASLIGLKATASETVGTVNLGSQYAWGENIGWVNFAPKAGGNYSGLQINDSAVTGYAWSSAVGWINFSPTNSGQGVTNTTSGQLGGSAWVSGMGWLPMSGVTINSSGKFTGIAGTEGSSVGRVSFDCLHCEVVTDWRPIASRTQQQSQAPTGSTGGGSITTSQTPPVTPPDDYFKTKSDLPASSIISESVLKESGGTVGLNSGNDSSIKVEIPKGAYEDDLKINISKEFLTPINAPSPDTQAFLIGGVIFNITATDSHGKLVHKFNKKISISIDIPKDLINEKDLGAYYLDDSNPNNPQWVLIPDAIFSNGKVTIQVDHLTVFGIFRTKNHLEILPVLENNKSKPQELYYWLVLLVPVLIFIFVLSSNLKKSKARS